MVLKIHITKDIKLKKPVLVEGFPGMGLVGTIAASYLVDKLDMKLMGHITSERFPPIVAVHNYKPLYPARIYGSKKYNLIVLVSEFVVPMGAVFNFSEEIFKFSKKKKVSQIISLGAIAQKSDKAKVFAITTNPKIVRKLIISKDVELVKEGATTGVTGVLLAKGEIRGMNVISFLSQSREEYMDPLASADVLKILKKYLKLKFGTDELENEAKTVESKMKELISKAKQAQEHYKRTESEGPDLGAMYG